MSGEKPVVKLVFKSKELIDGKTRYVNIAAYWEREGRLSGGLDRKIRGVVVHYEDGTKEALSANDWFLNLYDDRTAPSAKREVAKKPAAKPPAGGFDDDDIPF